MIRQISNLRRHLSHKLLNSIGAIIKTDGEDLNHGNNDEVNTKSRGKIIKRY